MEAHKQNRTKNIPLHAVEIHATNMVDLLAVAGIWITVSVQLQLV